MPTIDMCNVFVFFVIRSKDWGEHTDENCYNQTTDPMKDLSYGDKSQARAWCGSSRKCSAHLR